MSTAPAPLLAFHGDPKIKAKYVNRMNGHLAADQIVQKNYGTGRGKNFRGCFIGCTFHKGNAGELFPVEIGWDESLGRLVEGIFESLPADEAPTFAAKVFEVTPEGADLDLVIPKMLLWGLTDQKFGAVNFATDKVKEAVKETIDLLTEWIETGVKPGEARFKKASYAASYAASYVYAHAASSAYAFSAASAATSAASTAAAAYGAYAFYSSSEIRRSQAVKLLELLASAPVPA